MAADSSNEDDWEEAVPVESSVKPKEEPVKTTQKTPPKSSQKSPQKSAKKVSIYLFSLLDGS